MGGIGERRAKGRLCNSLFTRFSKHEKLKRNSHEGKINEIKAGNP